ncbi:serine/threonine protein kinase [Myxococcota bacterium]
MSYTRFPTRFGKYILLDRINSGGMAEVYRAKVTGAERFQRLVAIKCMLPQLNEDVQFTTMFVDEAKLAAQLSHANIVQIYELGRINEQLYIAMELVNGRDLRHVIKRAAAARTPIPSGFAAYVISKAAEGLDFAHRKLGIDGSPMNLVHRDVSPQNILVSYDGEVKVVDFGIAKAEVRDTETRAGVLKGKFAYMAPEQVTGRRIDRRADIFALGAVLFETLTGRKLFKGESDFSILEKVRAAEVPPVSGNVADVPEEVDAILRRALTRDRDGRYPWASDLAEDMSPLLINEKTIFGAKQAKEFIQTLYADDIEFLAQQLREYARITEADCVETSAQRRLEPRISEVFESDFSTIDDLSMEMINDDSDQPSTRLSDRTPHSGWTGAGSDPGKGQADPDATLLFDEPSKNAQQVDPLAETDKQPPLKPQPYEDSRSMRSGVSQPQPVPNVAKPVLVGLVVATIMVLVAVLVVIVVSKLRPGGTVVTPMELPQSSSDEPETLERTTSVVVGSGISGTQSDSSSDEAVPEAVEPPYYTPDKAGHKNKRKKKERPKFGFLSVRATGVKAAKVFVDGKDMGYSPIVYHRLRTGRHRVKIVPDGDGAPKVLDVVVAGSNTRKDPLKLLVEMNK